MGGGVDASHRGTLGGLARQIASKDGDVRVFAPVSPIFNLGARAAPEYRRIDRYRKDYGATHRVAQKDGSEWWPNLGAG